MSSGIRSIAGQWIGGISAPSGNKAGYRSILGFWLGGVCTNTGIIPPIPTVVSQAGGSGSEDLIEQAWIRRFPRNKRKKILRKVTQVIQEEIQQIPLEHLASININDLALNVIKTGKLSGFITPDEIPILRNKIKLPIIDEDEEMILMLLACDE